MMISRLLSRTIALSALAAVGAVAVNAQSITPVFISATGAAGNVTYTYQIFSTADTKTQAGDLFTFYDVNGLLQTVGNTPVFTPGQVGPNYSISIQNSGLNPPNTTISGFGGDDPSLPNITLTYTGTTFINPGPGSQNLGTLTFHSLFLPGGDFTPFAANSTKNSNGSGAGNQGQVTGPNVAPPGTPEPGTWALMVGMGVSSLAVVRRRRRK